LPTYRRRTRELDALIAGAYLAGTNTRRVGRALTAVFRGAISKSTVSRVWRQIKADWESWNKRDLGQEDIVRLILAGTVVKVRLDKKATSISLLVVLGVRRDGQKVLLAVKNMGGESEAAWRGILDDLTRRGLKRPELAIVDGAPGLEKALVSLWPDLPLQIEGRERYETFKAGRLVLYARFVLLSCFRFEGRALTIVLPSKHRRERLCVARIGRQAEWGVVDSPNAICDGVVALLNRRYGQISVLVLVPVSCPILADACDDAEGIPELDLILKIEACLVRRLQVIK
jgi:mutator family transposase